MSPHYCPTQTTQNDANDANDTKTQTFVRSSPWPRRCSGPQKRRCRRPLESRRPCKQITLRPSLQRSFSLVWASWPWVFWRVREEPPSKGQSVQPPHGALFCQPKTWRFPQSTCCPWPSCHQNGKWPWHCCLQNSAGSTRTPPPRRVDRT